MAFLTQVHNQAASNVNLATALLICTFTNTTRIRKVFVNVFADQVAGNGDYICYIKVQRAGAGSAYETIRTTKAAASGVTAICFQSIALTLNATDVLTVFLLGLAGDTTTPDVTVDVNEELLTDLSGSVGSVTGAVGSVAGAVGSVTGAVGSVTGNVGGNIVGSVASVTAGVTLAGAAVQAIWDALTSALTTSGSIGKRIADFITGDAFVRLGAAAGASVSADIAAAKTQVAAIETDTQDIQARLPAALTAAGNMKADTLRVNGTGINGNGVSPKFGV